MITIEIISLCHMITAHVVTTDGADTLLDDDVVDDDDDDDDDDDVPQQLIARWPTPQALPTIHQ